MTPNQETSVQKSHSTPNLLNFNQLDVERRAHTVTLNQHPKIPVDKLSLNTDSDSQSSCGFQSRSNTSLSDFSLACM